MGDWYYQIDKRVFGPYQDDEMREKIKSGNVPSNTLVSRNGFTDWQEASQCLVEKDSGRGKKEQSNKPRRNFSRFLRSQWKAAGLNIRSKARSYRLPLYCCLGIVLAVVAAFGVVKAGHGKRVIGWARRLLAASPSSNPNHYTLEKTRAYWLQLRAIEKNANENLPKLPPFPYPITGTGEPDMQNFADNDFEMFREFQLRKSRMARDNIEKLDKLPAAEVDPALLRYKLELSELWSLIDRAAGELAEITSDVEEHHSCFASPAAYALRFGTNDMKPSEAEYQNHKSREKIAEKIAQLKTLAAQATEAYANITDRETDVKTLLTSRYGWKFE